MRNPLLDPEYAAAAVRRELALDDDAPVHFARIGELRELIALANPADQFATTQDVWGAWVGREAVVRDLSRYVQLDVETCNGWTPTTPVLVVLQPPQRDLKTTGWHAFPFGEALDELPTRTSAMYATLCYVHDPVPMPA